MHLKASLSWRNFPEQSAQAARDAEKPLSLPQNKTSFWADGLDVLYCGRNVILRILSLTTLCFLRFRVPPLVTAVLVPILIPGIKQMKMTLSSSIFQWLHLKIYIWWVSHNKNIQYLLTVNVNNVNNNDKVTQHIIMFFLSVLLASIWAHFHKIMKSCFI